jgi:arylsulfatase A-like enzyme
LVAPAPDTPTRTYTLADETRPILGTPPEVPLRVMIPPGQTTHVLTVPPRLRGGTVIATGVLQRAKHLDPLPPQRLIVDGDTATLTLPAATASAGPPIAATLTLTAPPTAAFVEERARVTVPSHAALHFAYGLAEASAVPGAGPVTLEIVAAEHERPLWSTTVTPGTEGAHRWRDAMVPLDALADRTVTLRFRATPAGEAAAVLVPLWGDPTIVARGPRTPARRNVILISLDTLRADRVGVYGSYRPTTPALDALAGEAAVLSETWAPWPETSGSHMSLFTSRYPSEHGVTSFITTPVAGIALLAERLRDAGYLTRAFTENGGVWAHAGFARGFSAYGERRSPDFVYRGEAAATFADAAEWLESHTEQTFFLFVHTYEVHAPYAPPPEYQSLFADIPPREPVVLASEALAYDRETRHADTQVGRLMDAVRRLDLADRTIVIVTSDHGEEFGEHGGRGHGRSLHREVLQVPLIVWAPGLIPPARLAEPASLLDVAPTVLDLLGLPPDPGHRGRSLAAALRAATPDTAATERAIFAEVDRVDRGRRYRLLAIRRAGRTAILDVGDESVRCYGADDPGERHPTTDCGELVEALLEHRSTAGATGGHPTEAIDPRLVEKMRALGYLE